MQQICLSAEGGPTSCACSTKVALCWRTASTTLMAAARLKLDWDLQATRRGYMRAWGWCLPIRTSRLWIRRLTGCTVVWMRAITCTTRLSSAPSPWNANRLHHSRYITVGLHGLCVCAVYALHCLEAVLFKALLSHQMMHSGSSTETDLIGCMKTYLHGPQRLKASACPT